MHGTLRRTAGVLFLVGGILGAVGLAVIQFGDSSAATVAAVANVTALGAIGAGLVLFGVHLRPLRPRLWGDAVLAAAGVVALLGVLAAIWNDQGDAGQVIALLVVYGWPLLALLGAVAVAATRSIEGAQRWVLLAPTIVWFITLPLAVVAAAGAWWITSFVAQLAYAAAGVVLARDRTRARVTTAV
jgi:hypothetical protein